MGSNWMIITPKLWQRPAWRWENGGFRVTLTVIAFDLWGKHFLSRQALRWAIKRRAYHPQVASVKLPHTVRVHIQQPTQPMCLLNVCSWMNYSLDSHRQAGSGHYDFCVRHTEREGISHIFPLSRGSAFMEALRPFSFIPFILWIWKEKGDMRTGKIWPTFSLWTKSWMYKLTCWNKSLSHFRHDQIRLLRYLCLEYYENND